MVTFLRELLSRETSLFPLSTSNFEPLLELLFLHPPGSRLSRLNAQGKQVQCSAVLGRLLLGHLRELLVTLTAASGFLTLASLWARVWHNTEQLQTFKLG